MKYRRFFVDLDDTLLDFRASEKLSFSRTLSALGLHNAPDTTYMDYQRFNQGLWADLERGLISKEVLMVERFRRTFNLHNLDIDPSLAGEVYLDFLPQTVVLIDGAVELCQALSEYGEIGVITNGIESVQTRRIAASGLGPWLSFVATSEACGHAKPDARFFHYSAGHFASFDKAEAVIVGDRLEADIIGAENFGIDSCWFNPSGMESNGFALPTYEVARLNDVVGVLSATHK